MEYKCTEANAYHSELADLGLSECPGCLGFFFLSGPIMEEPCCDNKELQL